MNEPEPPAEAVASANTTAGEAQRVLLHMPVDVRSASLAILASLGCAFALYWAKAVFIPILLGAMASYALTPAVSWLHRRHVPRAAGAGLLLVAIVATTGWVGWSLGDDANALLDSLPQVVQKVRVAMRGSAKAQPSAMEKVQRAAAELERAAEENAAAAGESASAAAALASTALAQSSEHRKATTVVTKTTTLSAAPSPAATATRVVIEKPRFDVRSYLVTGTLGLFALLGQAAIVFFIAFFLLASGDTFRRKMVKLAGPTLSEKKVTIAALDEISAQIQRYLLVQVAVSVLVGLATWLVFLALGLNQAGVWGVIAGITNLIPYLGAVLVGGGSALVAFLQFGTVEMGLLVGASSFAIHTFIGNLLTPWWLGRASRMNPFVVFVAVLLFGWLWGIAGLLLGVPILMVAKAICDRVDDLKPVGELLGA